MNDTNGKNRIPSLLRRGIAAALVGILGAGVAACASGSTYNKRPKDVVSNRAVTAMWSQDVRRVAQTGDWILSRSYSTTGDIITAFTTGESVSHASIYDAERGTIIEALQPVVREVPLESLMDRNHVVIVVRPHGLTQEQRLASVARARGVVGSSFDFTGLFGAGDDDRFYCSELVLWASHLDGTAGSVVTPAELVEHGTVIYYSGLRSDDALIATAREIQSRDTVRTASR
jgi:uncharacterized protein YycO